MQKKILFIAFILIGGLFCFSCTTGSTVDRETDDNGTEHAVALGGNAFVVPQNTADIRSEGLQGWSDEETVVSVYLQASNAGELSVKLRARAEDASEVKVTVGGTSQHVTVDSEEYQDIDAGIFTVEKGYVKVDLQGVSKTGNYFADISDLVVSGTAVKEGALYSNEED